MKKKFISILAAILLIVGSRLCLEPQKAPNMVLFLNPVFAARPNAPTPVPAKMAKDADKAAAEKATADDASVKSTLNFYSGTFSNKDKSGNPTGPQKYSINNVANSLIPSVATWITSFLGALAVLSLFYSGYEFLTAGGDAEKVSHAAKSAYYVALGLVLMMFAYAIVYLLLTIFSG